jgi:hypothetical protein
MTIHIDLSNLGDPDEPFNDEVMQALGKSLTLWVNGHAHLLASINPSVTVSVDEPEDVPTGNAVGSEQQERKGDTHE